LVSDVTHTFAINTLASVAAVVRTREDGAVFTFKSGIADALPVEAVASLVAVLGASEL